MTDVQTPPLCPVCRDPMQLVMQTIDPNDRELRWAITTWVCDPCHEIVTRCPVLDEKREEQRRARNLVLALEGRL